MMAYIGELISIGVAFSWTATALLSEYGSKRLGNLTLNVLRMALALVFSLVLFGMVTGSPLPTAVPLDACGWMLLSGLVGYVIGDFCLFQCYIIIGSRYGQLFMTLAPLSAALMAWVTLGQQMTAMSIVAMLVTLLGIGISVLGRGEHHKVSLKLPLHGVLYAIGAAMCQGIGLVLSKIGMDHYNLTALAETGVPEWMIPFSANFYRCVAGIIGFTLQRQFLSLCGRYHRLHLVIIRARGHRTSARCPARQEGTDCGYGHHHLWSFRGSGVLTDGCTVHCSRYRLYADGDDPHHHPAALLLAVPREDHVACLPGSRHLRSRCQPVLPPLFLLTLIGVLFGKTML